MSEIDPNKLLDIAKGIVELEELTEEQKIENATKHWNTLPEKRNDRIVHRRNVRGAIFKILKYEARNMRHLMTPELTAIERIITEQLDPNLGMKLEGFTFVWDIHPTGEPVIVRKEGWVSAGGGFDPDIGVHLPSAFTQQVID